MMTYEKIENMIKDISENITVDIIEQDHIGIFIKGTDSHYFIEKIMDGLTDYLHNTNKLVYVDRVEYEKDKDRLYISFDCSLIENEDERTLEEIEEDERAKAEDQEFDAYRERDKGIW